MTPPGERVGARPRVARRGWALACAASARAPRRCRCPGRWSTARSSRRPPDEPGSVSEPLWELGLGVAGFRFPDYRGSDQTQHLRAAAAVLRLPRHVPARRPRRRARDPVRRPARRRRRQPRRVGADAAARTTRRAQGMPDLPGTFEIGPNLNVELWQSSDRDDQARPAPAGARGDHARALAARDRPDLLAQPEPRPRRASPAAGTSACSPARCSATSATTSTSTASRRSSRPRTRPAYEAPGRLRRLARDRGVLAPLRQRLGRRLRPLRQPARRGVRRRARWCAKETTRHRRLRHRHGSSRPRASAY